MQDNNLEKWEISIIDAVTRKTYDKREYLVTGEDQLEQVIDSLVLRFKNVGIDPDTLDIEVKFINKMDKIDA